MAIYLSPEETEEILNKVIELFVMPRFQELGMRASGNWEENVTGKSTGLNTGAIIGPDYTESLTKGTPPGTLVPIPDLVKWAKAKLNLSEEQATGAAYAIQKRIFENGTTWYQENGSDLMEVLEEPRTVQYVQEQVGGKFQLKIEDQLRRNAQEIFS